MRNFIKILLTSFIFLTTSLLAEDAGSLSVSIFKDGKPLKNVQVVLDTKEIYTTDTDGSLHILLNVGKHKLEIFGKENGVNLGYFRRSVEIKKDKDTQVTAEFTEDDSDEIDIDTPFDTDIAINKATGSAIFKGVLLSADTKKAIPNARIFVMGTDVDARTDEDGKFDIEVPSGIKLNVSFIHSEHTSQTLKDIVLTKDQTLTKTISLTPASMELEEFIVLAPKIEGSIASVMQEERKSSAVTNIIAAEQMSKQGDSSAAGAIKRVTGVTLVNGTDVYVRGLGGRYSNVEMNSMPLPSPDPQRRSVPLDIFPSAVIGSMKVQKSASADIPASFGGGYVDIRTKGKQSENYLKVSAEVKTNSYTGEDRKTYKGSDSDYLGYDDGYRDIPSSVINDSKVIVGERTPDFDRNNQEVYQQQITDRELNTFNEAMPFGGKFAIEGAYNMEIADKHDLSFFANYTYKQDYTLREEEYYKYAYQQSTNSLYDSYIGNGGQYGDIERSVDSFTNSLIANMEYNYSDAFKLKYTKLYSNVSEKTTQIADGLAGSNENDWKIRYQLNWESRTLDVDQVDGDFKYKLYDFVNQFSFGIETASAMLDQPSSAKYVYLRDLGYGGKVLGDPFLDPASFHGFTNMSVDDVQDALYIKNKTNFDLFDEDEYVELGITNTSKTRESRYNKYQMKVTSSDYKYTQNIDTIFDQHVDNYDNSFNLILSFKPSYWYDAKLDETTYFVKTMLKPVDKLEVVFGARGVDYTQDVTSYTYGDSIFTPIYQDTQTFEFNKILPSLNVKYSFDKSNIINLAYSQTYIVPDLREFTEGEYFHPYDTATVKGNPELVNTDIYNYDLKYSHYFSDSENIGFGVFYKDLKNPIEDTLAVSSSIPIYTYHNADQATLYGFEIDGRKSFAFIGKELKDLYIFGNFSYTDSDVSLTAEQQQNLTTNHRQLQGLSPTVINLALGYDTKVRSVTLSYNKMGERIRKVGQKDSTEVTPDDYEVPPSILDFVWIEKFSNGLSAKLKLQNLLDEETIWYKQDTQHVTRRYKVGQTYTLSASYKYWCCNHYEI